MTASRDAMARQAAELFRVRFGRPPTYTGVAPGRVNLIGEHTDYNLGFVLPMAIDRWIAVAADENRDAVSRIHSLETLETAEVDLMTPRRTGGFADYVLGVAAEFGGVANLDVLIHGNLAMGVGLASSAALEVAFARVLVRQTGRDVTPLDLARLCCSAEHAFAGMPCGIMDQLTAVTGRCDAALLIDCRSLDVRPIELPDDAAIVVADSGVRHDLTDGRFAERRRRCEDAAATLGVASLRDADRNGVRDLPEPLRSAAKHVIEENDRTLLAAAALKTGDLDALGTLMDESHASLRDLLDVSCPELDELVATASSLDGVHGARLTGAGFGGSVVVLCDRQAAVAVVEGLAQWQAQCLSVTT